MQQQTSSPAAPPRANNTVPEASNRSVWIYTGYIASALALIGVLAYHFSKYILK